MAQGNTGPIAGANFTSDTKSQPWRQPPEFTDLDDALDMIAKKLTDFTVANGVLTMAEIGLPLYKITSMLLLVGMGEGKWTPDFMLLMSGPVTRMIELICIGFEVEYDLGIYDDEDKFTTGRSYKIEQKLKSGAGFDVLNEELPGLKEEAGSGADGEDTAATERDVDSLPQASTSLMNSSASAPAVQGFAQKPSKE